MRYTLLITALIFAVVVAMPLGAADKKATTSGIYLTADDFLNGKLTSEGERDSSSHNINLHDSFFGKPYIDVTHNGENRRYPKSEIWGYRDFDGKFYRFVDNDAYEIREAGKLFIYSVNRLVTGRKGASEPVYYFSVGPAASVVPLTVTNLKMAFPENHRFHDYLDMAFRSDWDLTRFDKFHNMYRVNHFLISSESSGR